MNTLFMHELNHEIDTLLKEYIEEQSLTLDNLPEDIGSDYKNYVLTPGKRLRPMFTYWGWCSTGGGVIDRNFVNLCAALEMFHSFALIHDDIMDASDLRRGNPTLHQKIYRRASKLSTKQAENISILLGDLTLAYSNDLMDRVICCCDELDCVKKLYKLMQVETMYGQALDLVYENNPKTLERNQTQDIIEYKTSCYTMWRPFQLGAHLVGNDRQIGVPAQRGCLLLGRAYQLLDDLQGSVGREVLQDKPGNIDIITGKPTELLRLTYQTATIKQQTEVNNIYEEGSISEDDVHSIQNLMWKTGAVATMIEEIEHLLCMSRKEFLSFMHEEQLRSEVCSIIEKLYKRVSEIKKRKTS